MINNGGYTIERTILGRRARYNDVANWRYADLPSVLCREPRATSRVVATVEELRVALALPHESLMFVEVAMDPEDSPASLVQAGHASADLDYGPRGPQHAPGAQITVTN